MTGALVARPHHNVRKGVHQDLKAPEPWHFCGASSGAGRKRVGSGGAWGSVPGKCRLSNRFNTPYNRRWRVFATQTHEPEPHSVPCSTCTVLGTFAVLESCSGFCKARVQRHLARKRPRIPRQAYPPLCKTPAWNISKV